MTDQERIAQWIETCRQEHAEHLTPAQAFEVAVSDMRAAGFALPAAVVAGVRAELNRAPSYQDISHITEYGMTCRLQRPVRVF